MANEEQIAFWNGRGGERWSDLQTYMDRNLKRIHASLMRFAAPRIGERVLDVGCGAATTTIDLARAVGETGAVLGVDVAEALLALARTRIAKEQGGAPVELILGDAAAQRFAGDRDLVFSRFGVMFFDDPTAAFSNLKTALRPGGRLRFVCWRAMADNPWVTTPLAAARDLLPPTPKPDPRAPGPFAFADADYLRSILEGAGFRDVGLEKLDTRMDMGASLDEAADKALLIGPMSRMIMDLDDATRGKILAAVHAGLAQHLTDEGVTPAAACWLVRAET